MKALIGTILILLASTGYSRECERTVDQSFQWIQKFPKIVEQFRIDSAERLYSLHFLKFWDVPLEDDDMEYLCPLENLVQLDIRPSAKEGGLTELGLYELGYLPKLNGLALSGFEMRLSRSSVLCSIRSLKVLLFKEMKFVGHGLGDLSCLENLTLLGLVGSSKLPIADKHLVGISEITKSKTLGSLVIYNSSISDEGLKHIEKLKVSFLELQDAAISPGRGLKHLGSNERLRFLEFSNNPDVDGSKNAITAGFLGYLCRGAKLYRLNARYNDIDSLSGLGCIESLKAVDLYGNPLKPEDLRIFLSFDRFHKINIEKEIADSDHEVIQQLKAKFGDDLFTSRPNGAAAGTEGVKNASRRDYRHFFKAWSK